MVHFCKSTKQFLVYCRYRMAQVGLVSLLLREKMTLLLLEASRMGPQWSSTMCMQAAMPSMPKNCKTQEACCIDVLVMIE